MNVIHFFFIVINNNFLRHGRQVYVFNVLFLKCIPAKAGKRTRGFAKSGRNEGGFYPGVEQIKIARKGIML